MSMLFVELWAERPAWRAMDADARAAFMAGVQAALAPVFEHGITLLAAADLAPEGPQGWRHIAVWRAEDAAGVAAFRAALQQADWYDRFDQTDLAGTETALENILASHVDAN